MVYSLNIIWLSVEHPYSSVCGILLRAEGARTLENK